MSVCSGPLALPHCAAGARAKVEFIIIIIIIIIEGGFERKLPKKVHTAEVKTVKARKSDGLV